MVWRRKGYDRRYERNIRSRKEIRKENWLHERPESCLPSNPSSVWLSHPELNELHAIAWIYCYLRGIWQHTDSFMPLYSSSGHWCKFVSGSKSYCATRWRWLFILVFPQCLKRNLSVLYLSVIEMTQTCTYFQCNEDLASHCQKENMGAWIWKTANIRHLFWIYPRSFDSSHLLAAIQCVFQSSVQRKSGKKKEAALVPYFRENFGPVSVEKQLWTVPFSPPPPPNTRALSPGFQVHSDSQDETKMHDLRDEGSSSRVLSVNSDARKCVTHTQRTRWSQNLALVNFAFFFLSWLVVCQCAQLSALHNFGNVKKQFLESYDISWDDGVDAGHLYTLCWFEFHLALITGNGKISVLQYCYKLYLL